MEVSSTRGTQLANSELNTQALHKGQDSELKEAKGDAKPEAKELSKTEQRALDLEKSKEQREKQKLSSEDAASIKASIQANSNAMIFGSALIQGSFGGGFSGGGFSSIFSADFDASIRAMGYEGKPLSELSKNEAKELVSEDGFFGVDKTAQRIADFVINGAGGDEEKLKAGREGMLRGFEDAKKMLGDSMPDISKETMKKATEMVDKAISNLGFSIIDQKA